MISSKIINPYKIKMSKKQNKKNNENKQRIVTKKQRIKQNTNKMSLCILKLNWNKFLITLDLVINPVHFCPLTIFLTFHIGKSFAQFFAIIVISSSATEKEHLASFVIKKQEEKSSRVCCLLMLRASWSSHPLLVFSYFSMLGP